MAKKSEGLIPDEHEPLLKQILELHRFRFGDAATRKFLVDAAAFKVGPIADLTVTAFLRELYNGIPAAVDTTAPTPSPSAPVPSEDGLTRAQIEAAQLVGKKNRFSLTLPATRKMLSARIEGDHSRTSFEPLGWMVKDGKKKTDGGCVIAWLEGGVLYYGIFDWHGVGQTRKTMDNIPGGYMDGRQPPDGAPVWFGIVNYGYTARTTLKRSENDWKPW